MHLQGDSETDLEALFNVVMSQDSQHAPDGAHEVLEAPIFFSFFRYKVRYAERKRDREKDLPSYDSLPRELQRLELS